VEHVADLLALTAEADALPVVRQVTVEPRALLDKMSVLHGGIYLWQVEAQTLDDHGEVEQEGEVARSRFMIDLPALGAPKLPKGQAYYGR